MEINDFLDLTRNSHFLRFVAFLSVPQRREWRREHPEVPSVRGTLDRLMKLSRSLPAYTIQQQFVNEFTDMLVNIVEADMSLGYSEDDMDWFVRCLDHPGASTIFSLLFAYASCPVRWFSAEQVGQFTNKSPITWRQIAAADKIIGAKKIGKTWMFPETGLAAYGVAVPSPTRVEIEEEDNESEEGETR